jgi:hypothetical protein
LVVGAEEAVEPMRERLGMEDGVELDEKELEDVGEDARARAAMQMKAHDWTVSSETTRQAKSVLKMGSTSFGTSSCVG